MLHYQLNADEKRLTSKAARNGASFDYPTMWCLTGDGHANGINNWSLVTCDMCKAKGRPERFDVQIGARQIGAIGEMYGIKRHYVVLATPSTVKEQTINRAYEDGDIEHVRVEAVTAL